MTWKLIYKERTVVHDDYENKPHVNKWHVSSHDTLTGASSALDEISEAFAYVNPHAEKMVLNLIEQALYQATLLQYDNGMPRVTRYTTFYLANNDWNG